MSKMFSECKSLKELNLNNFNSNNVTEMTFMFNECSSLIELNLKNFNINKFTRFFFRFQFNYYFA